MSNVRDFGAVGDGRTDDSAAIQHAINDGDGVVEFPRGDYRIQRTLRIELSQRGRTSLHGFGGVAKLQMHGEGPCLELIATHETTADPNGFREVEWQRERMPTLDGLEIEGHHKLADGVRIQGVMQPTLTRMLIRKVRTAVHVTKRVRNLIVSNCHFYHNTGVGIHLDHVNLHQTNIIGNHISYCRLGGIRIDASEIRNLQITGNDIEYNNNRAHAIPNADAEPTAEIYIDCGTDGSVREGTIASNTIQATDSPGGANIRFIGNSAQENHRAGMWTISGNLIGSQRIGIHLTSARGFAISGNYIYSGHHRNLLVEQSRNIVVGTNCFGHNPDYEPKQLATGIRFVDSKNINLCGVLIEDAAAGNHTVDGVTPIRRQGLVEFVRCERVNLSGVQVLDPNPAGLYLEDCSDTQINGCTVLDGRVPPLMNAGIHWVGDGTGNAIANCHVGAGKDGDIIASSGVKIR